MLLLHRHEFTACFAQRGVYRQVICKLTDTNVILCVGYSGVTSGSYLRVGNGSRDTTRLLPVSGNKYLHQKAA